MATANLNFSEPRLATSNVIGNEAPRDWLWEVCCDDKSTLTQAALGRDHTAKRLNISTKYDATKRRRVEEAKQQVKTNKPRRIWFSQPCSYWCNFVDLNAQPA